MTNGTPLSPETENEILITLEFLEDGYVLKSGRSHIHRYELDLQVPASITCDQLLGAVYGALREVVTKRYHLDVKENLSRILYHDRLTMLEDRPPDPERGDFWLRPKALRDLRLRAASLRYAGLRRKMSRMDKNYPAMGPKGLAATPAERERLGWLVCWQVYLECFHAYSLGYPGSDGTANAQELLSEQFRCHPVIARGSVNFNSPENHMELEGAKLPLLWLEQKRHGDLTLKELGFCDASRLIFDPVLWHQTAVLFDERDLDAWQREALPNDNLSKRKVAEFDSRELCVLPPSAPPETAPPALAPIVLPPLITTGSVLAALYGMGTGLEPAHLGLLSGTMVASTVLSSMVNRWLQQRANDAALKRWSGPYEDYIREVLKQIGSRQEQDIMKLNEAYPPANGGSEKALVRKALRVSGDIYSRSPEDTDFLQVRLGTSKPGSMLVPSVFPVTGSITGDRFTGFRYRNLRSGGSMPFELVLPDGKKRAAEGRELAELPGAIAQRFAHLEHAPVLLDLKEYPSVALVVPQRMEHGPFLANLLLDLCFYHHPDDVQVLMLCRETEDWDKRQDEIARYKHLPHFRRLLPDRSAFAFGKREAWEILDQVAKILEKRIRDGGTLPHILIVAEQDYGLADHPVWELLHRDAKTGATALLCLHSMHELPQACTGLIRACGPQEWYLLPSLRGMDEQQRCSTYDRYAFAVDEFPTDSGDSRKNREQDPHYQAFKTLSALYDRQNARPAVPGHVELFRLLRLPDGMRTLGDVVDESGDMDGRGLAQNLWEQISGLVSGNWANADPEDLTVCIGRGVDGPVYLDLRDEADGAHLVVAGKRKSGKTAAVTSYLLGLCMRFPAEQLQLELVDLGGVGISGALGSLPHAKVFLDRAAGSSVDAQGQLQSYLGYLKSHITHRKLQLRQTGSATVSEHNRKCRARGRILLPQLFAVIEDFDELLDIVSRGDSERCDDLQDEILEIIEGAQGLGIHFILLCRKAEGCPAADLLDAIPARICMKVDSPETSLQILGTAQAAAEQMRSNGRGYLRRGSGSYCEYFQMGYSGGDIVCHRYEPFTISMIQPGGKRETFFDSEQYQPAGSDEDAVLYTAYGAAGPKAPPKPAGTVGGRNGSARKRKGGNAGDERQRDAGTGDVRPEWAQKHGGDSREKSQEHRAGDIRPDNAKGGDQRENRAGDVRPDHARGGDQRENRAGDVRPDNARGGDQREYRAGDVRPENARGGDQREHRAGDARPGKTQGARKKYKASGYRRKKVTVRRDGKNGKAHRHFRVRMPAAAARRVRVPRPDAALLRRNAVGMTQTECLVNAIRKCHEMRRRETD